MQIGNKNPGKMKLNMFLSMFTLILGKKHWKWVETMNWQFFQEEELLLFINHDINSKFSHFMKVLMNKILSQIFETELIVKKTLLAENQLELHFTLPKA